MLCPCIQMFVDVHVQVDFFVLTLLGVLNWWWKFGGLLTYTRYCGWRLGILLLELFVNILSHLGTIKICSLTLLAYLIQCFIRLIEIQVNIIKCIVWVLTIYLQHFSLCFDLEFLQRIVYWAVTQLSDFGIRFFIAFLTHMDSIPDASIYRTFIAFSTKLNGVALLKFFCFRIFYLYL